MATSSDAIGSGVLLFGSVPDGVETAPTAREQPPAEARLCLLGLLGGTATALDLPPIGRITIGRGAEADLQIVHPTVSRVHVAIHVEASTRPGSGGVSCVVEDLGSLNGTRVRGTRLCANERVTLELGESVELGSTNFVLQRRIGTGTSPKPPPVPVLLSSAPTPKPLQSQIDDLEREQILEALDACAGNQSRAARMLGMHRGTFIRRLEAYGVRRPRK